MANFKHISIDETSYDAVPAGSYVTGVKGNSESTYRTGNVNITKSNIGLSNVGNFKAVSTVASQGLSDTEKSNARANIGAGTSSFSGSYNDLSDKPTIPTVNNATLTIQKNGTNVQTFTANASSNKTANITVPTKTSELTNDSGFTTNTGTVTQVKVGTTAYNPSSGIVSLPAYPTVNNATLTIQKNGTNVQTFTANSSSNKTANITVPTKTSELTNDSGFITNAGVTGVKGNSETTYRTGNVNITKGNIGLGNVPNVSTNNQTPTFTQASTRANIASGETLATIFGKIIKWFTDLKSVAFSGSYSDLSNKPITKIYKYYNSSYNLVSGWNTFNVTIDSATASSHEFGVICSFVPSARISTPFVNGKSGNTLTISFYNFDGNVSNTTVRFYIAGIPE